MTDNDKNLIAYNIKPRNDTYFLVTDSDLNEIGRKNKNLDIAMLFNSVVVGGLISVLITLAYNIDLNKSALNILYVLLIIFLLLSIIGIFVFFGLWKEREKFIHDIKGKEEISLHVKDYQKGLNIERYKGNDRLGVNVKLSQKALFLSKIEQHPEFSLLFSTQHINVRKTEYFTFVFENANHILKDEFKAFLDKNSIEHIDFGYLK